MHSAHILTDEGDITLSWDPKVYKDRQDVSEIFEKFLELGYEAYEVNDEPGKLDTAIGCRAIKQQITELNEYIGKIILTKKVVVAPGRVLGGYPSEGMNKGRL